MRLKYRSIEYLTPIGLSVLVLENWESVAVRIYFLEIASLRFIVLVLQSNSTTFQPQQNLFEQQISQDVVTCLQTDPSRIEIAGSEQHMQLVTLNSAWPQFFPTIVHFNILTPSAVDSRPSKVLSA